MGPVLLIDIPIPVDSTIGMNLSFTTNIKWLASDQFLENLAIHPGDELQCLGYPLQLTSNDARYPILRSGKIASYPVIPQKTAKQILFDFRVYPGNSGGPVYFSYSQRLFKGTYRIDQHMTYQKILGLVSQMAGPVHQKDPSVGIIVPAIFIKETIDALAGFESTLPSE